MTLKIRSKRWELRSRLARAYRRLSASARRDAECRDEIDRLRAKVSELERMADAGRTAESRLRDSEARLRAIIENSPTAISLKDRDGRYILFNRHFEELTGLSRNEVRGKRSSDLFPPGFARSGTAHDREVLETGEASAREEEFPGVGDPRIWWTIKFPVFDEAGAVAAVGAVSADITERRRAEQARRHSEERFRSMVEGSIQGVLVQTGWQILFVNRALADLFGYDSPEEVVALGSVAALLPPEEAERMEALYRARERGELVPSVYEFRGRRKDGTEIWCENRVRWVDWEGQRSVQGFMIDVTARKRAEQALSEARDELESRVTARTRALADEIAERKRVEVNLRGARDQADLANRAKTQFLANMSHELRTPLNAILGFAQVMRGELLGPVGNPTYLDYANDILTSGQHLLEIIDDILDLSKIEAGKHALEEEPHDLSGLVGAAVRIVQPRADEAGHVVTTEIPAELPQLLCDKRAMKQILINLLSNAIKFTPDGGRISIRASREAEGIALLVSDNGVGISAENQARVLEPFTQVEGALARRRDGTGLGLPLAKRLTELHHGTLEMVSGPMAGTTVRLFFPEARVHEAQPKPPASASAGR